MGGKVDTKKAIRKVEEFLAEIQKAEYPNETALPTIELLVWPNKDWSPPAMDRHECVGVRVAEVGFIAPDRMSGSTFMQVDQDSAPACFFAERLVIAFAEEWPEAEILDEKWRLVLAVFGEDAAKKFADSSYPVEV